MQQLGMGQAVHQALREEMMRDARVFIAGEGVGVSIHDNPMLPTAGLLKEFGPKRVRDTPVSEAAIAGLAVGAAAAGLRPVVEIMFNPFFTLASDMIVNHAAKLRYLSGGKSTFPLVVRMKSGAGFGAGCQHAHNLEAWVAHCPGLKVVMPSTPADAKGLLKSAIRDDNPVVFIEDMMLSKYPLGPGLAACSSLRAIFTGPSLNLIDLSAFPRAPFPSSPALPSSIPGPPRIC